MLGPGIPLEFMLTASTTSLSDFQLRRLNEAANLKRDAREKMEEAIDKLAEAAVACWFRMHREDLLRACSSITVPNEAEFRLWLREHGDELLKMCNGPGDEERKELLRIEPSVVVAEKTLDPGNAQRG